MRGPLSGRVNGPLAIYSRSSNVIHVKADER